MNYKIRSSQTTDYDKLMGLYTKFIGIRDFSNHDQDSFTKVMQTDDSRVLVAEDGDRLIGLAMFSKRYVVRYPKPIVELDELFVLEEYRKQGVGGALIAEVEKAAKKMGCGMIYLESHMDRTVAHDFYEAKGYNKYGFCFKKEL